MPLRFDTHRETSPRRPLVDRSQWRLMSLVAGLALVIVMMQVAQSPDTKRKLELLFGESQLESRPISSTPPGDGIKEAGCYEGVEADLLDSVEDNTTFRDKEAKAWFHLFEVVREADPVSLESASLGNVARAQLIGQPQFYRGRVATVRGIAKRIEITQPDSNDLGIDKLYRVILQPHRDAQLPFTLYCLELPTGWSTESPRDAPIEFTGFFFKNWLYGNQTGVDLSPVFVSKTITPLMQEVVTEQSSPSPPMWQIVALAAAVSGVLVAFLWVHGKPTPRVATTAKEARVVAESLRALDADGS